MRVFVDTNILLDVLAKRHPFFADSAAIWTLAETGKIEGLVSAVSFTNIFYVVRKLADAKTALRMLVLLRDSFHAVACDHQIVSQAIDSGIKDFEDAVQYHSALHAGADCIVSRNPDHFPRTMDCPVVSPAEFLATNAFE
jgi:predicted nucleic acid-binding protein